ncbi:hypothetical protein [Nonomuraea sp. NPDC052265]|uniref:hypothetical protein n=1 Tax=Nonomuraea sp. NPDC052265 TaxID=3364374 RepID=UPI0037CA3C5F
MTPTDPSTLNVGDAVIVEDTPGIWIVFQTEADGTAHPPAQTPWIRAQRVYDGEGPCDYARDFRTGQATLITGGYVAGQRDGGPAAHLGYRLTAGREAILVVPRHAAATVSDRAVLDEIHTLQAAVHLTADASLVDRSPTGWKPALS